MAEPYFGGDHGNELLEDRVETKALKVNTEGLKSTPFSDPLQAVKHDKLTGQVIPAAGRVESPTTRATDNGCDHGGKSQPVSKSESSLATAITPDRPASIPTSINLPKEVRDVEVGKKPDQHFLSIPKLLAAEESIAKSKPQADHFAFKTNDNPIINRSSKSPDGAGDHAVRASKADVPATVKADAISPRASAPADRIESSLASPMRTRIESSSKAEIQPLQPPAKAEQPEIKRFIAMSTAESKSPALDRPRESSQRIDDVGAIRRESFQVKGPTLQQIESQHLIGIDRRAAIVRGEIPAPIVREQKMTESKPPLPERETSKVRPSHEEARVGDKKTKVDVPSMLVESTAPRGGTGMSGPRSDIFTVKTKKESEAEVKNQGQKTDAAPRPFILNETPNRPLTVKEVRVQDKVEKSDKPDKPMQSDKVDKAPLVSAQKETRTFVVTNKSQGLPDDRTKPESTQRAIGILAEISNRLSHTVILAADFADKVVRNARNQPEVVAEKSPAVKTEPTVETAPVARAKPEPIAHFNGIEDAKTEKVETPQGPTLKDVPAFISDMTTAVRPIVQLHLPEMSPPRLPLPLPLPFAAKKQNDDDIPQEVAGKTSMKKYRNQQHFDQEETMVAEAESEIGSAEMVASPEDVSVDADLAGEIIVTDLERIEQIKRRREAMQSQEETAISETEFDFEEVEFAGKHHPLPLHSNSYNNYLYIVKEGDTIESVAAAILKDPWAAPLIFEKNKKAVLQSRKYGEHPLKVGATISLPTAEELKQYYARKRK
jgi:hypothetical protein